MKKSIYLIVMILLGCAAPQKDDYITYIKKAPPSSLLVTSFPVSLEGGQLDVRGEYDSDDAFDHNAIMYSGDAGLVGMLAQVATHAAISNNAQNARLSEQQLQSNKVLEPLSDILKTMTTELLHFNAEDISWEAEFSGSDAPPLISKPIFFMSQDARVLSLKHIVSLKSTDKVSRTKKAQLIYSNLIEVLAAPVDVEAPLEYWLSDDGQQFKIAIKSLYKQSLQLALSDIKGELQQQSTAETFKFQLQNKLRFERGNRLIVGCNQLVIRNLRGWILVLPAMEGENETSPPCSAS
jgi:hypothetical protein